jgi:chemotaxis protein histidine kinase CheA
MLNNLKAFKIFNREAFINNRKYFDQKIADIIKKITSSKLHQLEKKSWINFLNDSNNNYTLTLIKKFDILKGTKELIDIDAQTKNEKLIKIIERMEVQSRMAIIDCEIACSKINSLIRTITWILDKAMVIESPSAQQLSESELESEVQHPLESEVQKLSELEVQQPSPAQQLSESEVQQLSESEVQQPSPAQQLSESEVQQLSESEVQQLSESEVQQLSESEVEHPSPAQQLLESEVQQLSESEAQHPSQKRGRPPKQDKIKNFDGKECAVCGDKKMLSKNWWFSPCGKSTKEERIWVCTGLSGPVGVKHTKIRSSISFVRWNKEMDGDYPIPIPIPILQQLLQQQPVLVAEQLLVLSTQQPSPAQQSSSSSSSSAVQQLTQQPTDEILLNAKRQRKE